MEDLRCSSGLAADHLVVMVHGILGSSCDWKFAANQFLKTFPEKVMVHCSECNVYTLTLDGIDVMGDRLANEVIEVINRKPEVRKISFVAHSMGGLVARYAIGKLYTPSGKLGKSTISSAHNISVGTIHGLEAVNFITIATPHLGSRGNRQVPMFLGIPTLEKVAAYVAPWIFRRTGKHLFLTDSDEGDLPLLQRMVTDNGGIYFMSALKAFNRRVAYANACYDHIVGWRTSSLRRHSELPKWEVSLCTRYPHIVHEEYTKEENTGSAEITGCPDKIEEELVMGLRKVSWEKVDVSFHRSILRFAAHSVIQVKRDFLCSDGADVIQHLIDRFVV